MGSNDCMLQKNWWVVKTLQTLRQTSSLLSQKRYVQLVSLKVRKYAVLLCDKRLNSDFLKLHLAYLHTSQFYISWSSHRCIQRPPSKILPVVQSPSCLSDFFCSWPPSFGKLEARFCEQLGSAFSEFQRYAEKNTSSRAVYALPVATFGEQLFWALSFALGSYFLRLLKLEFKFCLYCNAFQTLSQVLLLT